MTTTTVTMADLMTLLTREAGLPIADQTTDTSARFADVGLDSLAFLAMQTDAAGRLRRRDARRHSRTLHVRRDPRRDQRRCLGARDRTGVLTRSPAHTTQPGEPP